MKKLMALLIAICSVFLAVGISACKVNPDDFVTGIIGGNSSGTEVVIGKIDVDLTEFDSVITYDSKIPYETIKIVTTTNLGGNGTSQIKVPCTEEMIVSGGETNTVGTHELVISYGEEQLTVEYTVKYLIEFTAFGEVVGTQHVLTADEIVCPEGVNVEGYTFSYWSTPIPEVLTDNMAIEAHYYDNSKNPPQLAEITTVYDKTATIAQLTLPSSKDGKWVFVDDLSTLIGGVGIHEFDVAFIPEKDGEVPASEGKFTVKVTPQPITLTVNESSFVYDGNVHIPTCVPSVDVELEYMGGSNVNAGTYSYTYLVADPNYEGFCSGTYEITKPEVVITVNSYVKKFDEANPTVEYVVDGFANQAILGISVVVPNVENVGVYPLTVTVENKNVNATVINGTLTVNKADITDLVYPTLSSETVPAIYESTLSTVTLSGDYRGVWSWVNPDQIIDSMVSVTAPIIFTPNTSNYNVVEAEATITNIDKRTLSITIKENEFTYDTKEHSIVFEIEDGKNVTVDGQLTKINAGSYATVLTINDDCYAGSAVVALVINKAVPETDFSVGKTITWNSFLRLSDVELDQGYTWDDPNTALYDFIGTKNLKATYTPADTENYIKVHGEFAVTVNKAQGAIHGVLDSYTFTYNKDSAHTLSGITSTPANGVITYVYELNGEVVGELKVAGTYKVTVNLAESTYYTSAQAVTEVVINKVVNKDTVFTEQTAIYGAKLSTMTLPTNAFGTWSWKNATESTTVGNVGENTFVAVYTPNDPDNYEGREVDVIVTVSKQTITKPTAKTSFVYTGSEIVAFVVPENALYGASGALTAVNVGEYKFTLTLSDANNYKWSSSEDASIEFTYKVTQASNAITALEIAGWTYGENANAPTLQANFGADTVVFYYAPVRTTEYTTVVPQNAGSYNLKAVINETANYDRAEKVIENAFVIAKAQYTDTLLANTYEITWSNGITLASITNLPAGYTWTNSETVLVAGTTATYGVTYVDLSGNYNPAYGEFTVKVNKATYEIETEMTFGSVATTETTHDYNGSAFVVTANAHDGIDPVYYVDGVQVSQVSFVNAGTYDVKVVIAESANYIERSKEITVTINQAKVTYVLPAWNPTFETIIGELALPTVNEALNGGYSWIWQDVNGNPIESTQLVSVSEANVDYKLHFASNDANYKSFTVDVHIAVGKIVVAPTLKVSTFEYTGSAIAVEVEGASEVSYTLTYCCENACINAGDHTVTLTMLDGDFVTHYWQGSSTNVVTLAVKITKVTNVVEKVEIAGWTYGETASVPTVETKFGGEVTYSHYNVNNANQVFAGIPVTAGTYVLIATSEATDNYVSSTLSSAEFTIAKATPTVEFTINYTETWSSELKLSDITPVGDCSILGAYTWVESGETALEIGETAFTVKFTPNDTVNYNVVEKVVTVTVNKATATISGVKLSYSTTYNGEVYTLSGITASHSEATLAFAYTLNGATVEEIKNAGTYSVTITLAETEHYNQASATTTVTVEKAENEISNFAYNSATKEFTFDASYKSGAVYEYKKDGDPDTSYNTWVSEPAQPGTYVIRVTIPESDNYKVATATCELSITKELVTATFDQEGGNVYTGEAITVTVTLDKTVGYTITCEGEGATVNGNVVTVVNAGTYTITLALTDTQRYAWNGSNVYTFTIAKAEVLWNAGDMIAGCDSYNEETQTFTRAYSEGVSSMVVIPDDIVAKYGTPVITYYKVENGVKTALASGEYPINAGNYAIVVLVATTENYAKFEREIYLIINPIATTLTAPVYTANQYQDQFPFDSVGYGYTTAPVVKTTNGGEDVAGTFEYSAYTIVNGVNEEGVYVEYTLIFTPSDSNYQGHSVAIQIALKKVAHVTTDNGATRTYYGTIEDALEAATEGEVWVLPDKTGNVIINDTDGDGIVTIRAGVTLVIPFAVKTNDYVPRNEKGGYADTDGRNPEGKVYSNEYGKTLIATKAKVDSIVILKAGVTLSVSGELEIAGRLGGGEPAKFFAGQTYEDYAQMTLEDGAEIIVNNGGKLNLTGYIRGENGKVTIDYGADLYIPFILNDHNGGTYMGLVVLGSDAAAFNRYQFRNIEKALLRVNYGGEMYVYANMYGGETADSDGSYNHAEALFIASTGVSSKTAVINLSNSNSYVTSRFIPGDYGDSHYPYLELYQDVCELNLYGGATLEQLELTLMGQTISSIDFDFPIPNYYHISLHDGSYAMNNNVKLLPGAKLTVEKGASLTATKLSVYTSCHFILENFGDHKFYNETASKIPAIFTVNGEFTATSFGGKIYTTNPGAKVMIKTNATTSVKEMLGKNFIETPSYTTYTHTLSLTKSSDLASTYTAAGTYYSDGSAWYKSGENVTISFMANGEVYHSVSRSVGTNSHALTTADFPSGTPTRKHYEFSHWCLTDGCTNGDGCSNEAVAGTVVRGNAPKVYAAWNAIEYTLHFVNVTPDGTVVDNTGLSDVTFSMDMTEIVFGNPASPEEGANYAGWYDASENGNPIGVTVEYFANLAKENGGTATIYAIWIGETTYTINYQVASSNKGDSYGIRNGSVKESEVDSFNPTNLTLSGSSFESIKGNTAEKIYFDGWYIDSGYTTKWTSWDSSLLNDTTLTLYGKWIDKYEVTFKSDHLDDNTLDFAGTTIYLLPEQVEDGVNYTLPSVTELTGISETNLKQYDEDTAKQYYYGGGWSKDGTLVTTINSNLFTNKSLTLNVLWLKKSKLSMTVTGVSSTTIKINNTEKEVGTHYVKPTDSVYVYSEKTNKAFGKAYAQVTIKAVNNTETLLNKDSSRKSGLLVVTASTSGTFTMGTKDVTLTIKGST